MSQIPGEKGGSKRLVPTPKIEVKSFSELSNLQVHNIFKLRYNVFVREQKSIFDEYDDHDFSATHVFVEDNGEIIAYARTFRESANAAVIGRVAVAKEYRSKGLARQVVEQAIVAAKNIEGINTISIEAQTYLQPFYESLGFIQTSKPYDDEGVEHINMSLTLPRTEKPGKENQG